MTAGPDVRPGALIRATDPLSVRDLGRAPYREVWALQKELVEARHAGDAPDMILVVEHEPVVTTGRGTEDATLRDSSVEVVEVERGGQATWHGPGQIVVYPIVKLADDRHDLHGWMHALEQAVIDTMAEVGLASGRRDSATGVWIDGERKLCSIGVAARRWVTYHGLALNHEPDLSQFAAINPCGFDAAVMTSMRAELGERCPARDEVVATLVRQLESQLLSFREATGDVQPAPDAPTAAR
jgi:lipoate-protein ligase B